MRTSLLSFTIVSIATCWPVGCSSDDSPQLHGMAVHHGDASVPPGSGHDAGAGGGPGSKRDAGKRADTGPSTGGSTVMNPDSGPSHDGASPDGASSTVEPVVVTAPNSASAQIDEKGGMLELANAKLWIPPGDLTAPTVVQISVTPADPADTGVIGETYDLSPEGLTFSAPAVLVIRRTLHTNGAIADDLVIATRSSSSSSWVEQPSWSANSEDVAAKISHFSPWGTVKPKSKPPRPPCDPSTRPNNLCTYDCNPSTHQWEKTFRSEDTCGADPDCFNLNTDEKHCGSCSDACKSGEVCFAGLCACIGASSLVDICGPNDVCVAGKCTCPGKDLTQDPDNCGGCHHVCLTSQGEQCVAGTCTCMSGGKIANLMTDHDNCGVCGNVCMAQILTSAGYYGEQCIAGKCTCIAGGQVLDLMTDVTSCGTCGHSCQPNEQCVAGKCTCIDRNGKVANLMTDHLNCGSCGLSCINGFAVPGGTLGSACLNGVCCGCIHDLNNPNLVPPIGCCPAGDYCSTSGPNPHCGGKGSGGLSVCPTGYSPDGNGYCNLN